MPYIKQEDRDTLRETHSPKNQGELNYFIHSIIDEHLVISYSRINDIIGSLEEALDILLNEDPLRDKQPQLVQELYRTLNKYVTNDTKLNSLPITESGKRVKELNVEIKGVIRCVQMELYRRIASPYEDKKILENGDAAPYKGK